MGRLEPKKGGLSDQATFGELVLNNWSELATFHQNEIRPNGFSGAKMCGKMPTYLL